MAQVTKRRIKAAYEMLAALGRRKGHTRQETHEIASNLVALEPAYQSILAEGDQVDLDSSIQVPSGFRQMSMPTQALPIEVAEMMRVGMLR